MFSALWLRWQVFYEVYKQCHQWLNERLTTAEQFSPLAKSDMKSVKIEMEQLKVCVYMCVHVFAYTVVWKIFVWNYFIVENIHFRGLPIPTKIF